jgi:hypothetical protein
MNYELKEVDKFKFIEEGEGETLLAFAWFVWCHEQFCGPHRAFSKEPQSGGTHFTFI